MYELNSFQRDVLVVVAGEKSPHGLAIKELLEEYYDEDVNHGRLYPNLDDLVDLGLIDKEQRDRRTNEYSLTQEGRDALVERRVYENNLAGELFEGFQAEA